MFRFKTAHHRTGSLCLLVVYTIFPLGSALGAGQDAAPYGEGFVRAGVQWPEGGPVLSTPAPSDKDMDVRAFDDQLDQLEIEQGPYGAGLAERLTDLGRYHEARGDYEQALAFYARALHNVRVNDGLYSERQVPLVRELLNLYRRAEEYEALYDRYDYFFRLYGSGQPPYDEVRMRATLEYLRWQREAYRRGLRDSGRDLLRLYERTRDLLNTVSSTPAVSDDWRRELTFSQLRNLYLLERDVQPFVEVNGVGASVASPFPSTQNNDRDFARQRLESIDRSILSRGRRLLEELLVTLPGIDHHGRALVYRELGDWYQWNGNSRRAQEQYQAAMENLVSAGLEHLVEEWFGEPVELPDNGVFWRGPDDAGEWVSVNVVLSVSDQGRPRLESVAVADPTDEPAARRLQRWLSDTRFRPVFRGGEPLATDAFERLYRVYRD